VGQKLIKNNCSKFPHQKCRTKSPEEEDCFAARGLKQYYYWPALASFFMNHEQKYL